MHWGSNSKRGTTAKSASAATTGAGGSRWLQRGRHVTVHEDTAASSCTSLRYSTYLGHGNLTARLCCSDTAKEFPLHTCSIMGNICCHIFQVAAVGDACDVRQQPPPQVVSLRGCRGRCEDTTLCCRNSSIKAIAQVLRQCFHLPYLRGRRGNWGR